MVQRLIWDHLENGEAVKFLYLKIRTEGKKCIVPASEIDKITKASEAVRSLNFRTKKIPKDAYSFFVETGELLYWMHPRDAFLTRLYLLFMCKGKVEVCTNI
jgi:hypothetical protein